MRSAAVRAYQPVFAATVVPTKVEPLITVTREPYTRLRAPIIIRGGQRLKSRTVLAFDTVCTLLDGKLSPGQPIDLVLQDTGSTLRVLKIAPATQPAPPAEPRPSLLDSDAPGLVAIVEIIAEHLAIAQIDTDSRDSIINSMLDGSSSRPAADHDNDIESDDVLSHIIVPILELGIDHDTACAIAAAIHASQAGPFLANRKLLREQQSAFALLFAAATE